MLLDHRVQTSETILENRIQLNKFSKLFYHLKKEVGSPNKDANAKMSKKYADLIYVKGSQNKIPYINERKMLTDRKNSL